MQPSRRRGGALWGLIGGAILITLYIIYRFILRAVNRRVAAHARAASVITGMQFAFFCGVIVLLALLGFIAARRARRFEAGVAAAAIAGVLLALVQLGVALIDAYHARRHGQPSLGSPALTAVKDFIALSLAAVGAGTLGALAGRGPHPEPPIYAAAPFTPGGPVGPSFVNPPASPFAGPAPAGSYPSVPPVIPSQPPASPEDFATMPSLH
jgi:hypothetical protein